jgi:hypothetical protein
VKLVLVLSIHTLSGFHFISQLEMLRLIFLHAVSYRFHVTQASYSLLLITKYIYEFWDYVAEVRYETKLIKIWLPVASKR